jgi:hypothetical protein
MAPLAAAAAVIAVIATAVTVTNSPHQPGSDSLLNRLPHYYMTLVDSRYAAQHIVVKDTRTGATLVTARPPAPYHSFAAIAGAPDDRTFVLAARPVSGNVTRNSQYIEKLFRARLDPAKRTLTMTPLPIPEFTPSTLLDGMALSPDGTEIAVALETGRFHYQLEIRLYSLAGELLKTWQSNGKSKVQGPALMSWAGNGVLAINWTRYTRNSRNTRAVYQSGLWLLNTNAASGSLVHQSRLIVPDNVLSGFLPWGDALLSSNGETIVTQMIGYGPGAPLFERSTHRVGITPIGAQPYDQPGDSWKIEEFSAATGRPIRALWPVHSGGKEYPLWLPGDAVMWTNASGSIVVLQATLTNGPPSHWRLAMGVLSGNHFRPIPGTVNTKLTYYYSLVF